MLRFVKKVYLVLDITNNSYFAACRACAVYNKMKMFVDSGKSTFADSDSSRLISPVKRMFNRGAVPLRTSDSPANHSILPG